MYFSKIPSGIGSTIVSVSINDGEKFVTLVELIPCDDYYFILCSDEYI